MTYSPSYLASSTTTPFPFPFPFPLPSFLEKLFQRSPQISRPQLGFQQPFQPAVLRLHYDLFKPERLASRLCACLHCSSNFTRQTDFAKNNGELMQGKFLNSMQSMPHPRSAAARLFPVPCDIQNTSSPTTAPNSFFQHRYHNATRLVNPWSSACRCILRTRYQCLHLNQHRTRPSMTRSRRTCRIYGVLQEHLGRVCDYYQTPPVISKHHSFAAQIDSSRL